MKQHQRADNIINFTDDTSTKVLLLSMKAGSAGLNLVSDEEAAHHHLCKSSNDSSDILFISFGRL